MDILSVIERKKKGLELSEEELAFAVNGYTDGTIPDYQTAALLMAICLRDMTDRETASLARVMRDSGETLDLSAVDGITVDKHSTGGVSDSTTLIVVPTLAALGFKVAKMSGRALGFTGGTIDKLETFRGYRTELTREEFLRIVNSVGASLMGASMDFAPADKRIYALRDVTGTVDSVPLIAASIMSKKLAAGASVILLDVKYGDGALCADESDARRLARLMTSIGKECGRRTGALVTSMEQPLGCEIGSGEVYEAVEILRGHGVDSDLCRVAVELTAAASELAGVPKTREEVERTLLDGRALAKLEEMVCAHGGEFRVEPPHNDREVRATSAGFVTGIRTRELGSIVARMGGGRSKLGDAIDHTAGVALACRLGDRVECGDVLCRVSRSGFEDELRHCFVLGDAQTARKPLIAERLM